MVAFSRDEEADMYLAIPLVRLVPDRVDDNDDNDDNENASVAIQWEYPVITPRKSSNRDEDFDMTGLIFMFLFVGLYVCLDFLCNSTAIFYGRWRVRCDEIYKSLVIG